MRLAILALMVVAAGAALAQDLGNFADHPVKNTPDHSYISPETPRQGGDTVADAVPIAGLPFTVTGTTEGFIDDYDEECPYDSTSPDVVYSFTPTVDILIDIDLCGSAYDTKVYVYDPDFNLMGCNDDFYFDDVCGVYVSKLESVALVGGITYYVVVDGYGGYFGEYLLNISEFEECDLVCHPDAVLEGEPPLQDGYIDQYNVGCSGNPPVWQPIDWTNDADGVPPYDGTAWLCGKSGWFLSNSGSEYRDTDWFTVFALETGMMECTFESEEQCYLFKLAPTDCATVGVEFQVTADCDLPATMSFPVTAGEEIWLWVGPSTFSGPGTEFTYFLTVSNNTFDVVSPEDMSWGQVKALYR